MTMEHEKDELAFGYVKSIERSLKSIAESVHRIAECLCGKPGSLAATHGEPQPEGEQMSKPAKFGLARAKHKFGAATVPAGDKDTVTIAILDQQGNPYTGPLVPTVTASSSDGVTLTTDPPTGLTYGEHFLKAGTAAVHIGVSFDDGSTLPPVDDLVTITGSPGSFTVTHSAP